jgi:hypothetical protein
VSTLSTAWPRDHLKPGVDKGYRIPGFLLCLCLVSHRDFAS